MVPLSTRSQDFYSRLEVVTSRNALIPDIVPPAARVAVIPAVTGSTTWRFGSIPERRPDRGPPRPATSVRGALAQSGPTMLQLPGLRSAHTTRMSHAHAGPCARPRP